MKALNWIAWISGVIGVIFLLSGFLSAVFGRFVSGVESVNYFHAANSFLLITISLFIYLYRCQCKED